MLNVNALYIYILNHQWINLPILLFYFHNQILNISYKCLELIPNTLFLRQVLKNGSNINYVLL